MNPIEFWKGEGGTEYTARNRVDWRERIPFWREVIEMTGARSVYEVGCNAGWNLSAIRRAWPDIRCYGHDANEVAVEQANRAGLSDVRCETEFPLQWRYDALVVSPVRERVYKPRSFDLVFTAGVLIHQPPEQLDAFMRSIIEHSSQWVLAVEYDAHMSTEVEYRGQRGLLWKRPYGMIYEGMGLKLVREWDAGPGFDRCTAWLMEIPR